MSARIRSLTVGVALVVGAALCVGGLYVYRIFARTSPAKGPIEIVIHKASALDLQPEFTSSAHYRIRLPRGFVVRPARASGELVAILNDGIIMIDELQSSDGRDFSSRVRSHREWCLDFRDAKIESEGAVTLSGLNGYSITHAGRLESRLMMWRDIFLQASNNRYYSISVVTNADGWDANADLFDSSISTLEIVPDSR